MKVKKFFEIVWYYISYPFTRRSDKKTDKKLREIAAEDRAKPINESDVEFFKSIGTETDLETLRNKSISSATSTKTQRK